MDKSFRIYWLTALFFLNTLLPFHGHSLESEIEPQYVDSELQALWSSIEDITCPKYEDYLKIEDYLKYGRRSYLDVMFQWGISKGILLPEKLDRPFTWWNRLMQRICFATPTNPTPILECEHVGVSHQDKSNCIVMYASCNSDTFDKKTPYGSRLLKIVDELKQSGYQGHILYRIGGYPATAQGGLKFSHIPYSFKVLSFLEAFQLGYKNVLWIDCSVHPTTNLSQIFKRIQKDGYFFLTNNVNLHFDYSYHILPDQTIAEWGTNFAELQHIKHIWAGIIGISYNTLKGRSFFDEWYRLTSDTLPAMSLYPEEFLLSISSHFNQLPPSGDISQFVTVIAPNQKRPTRCTTDFLFDKGFK